MITHLINVSFGIFAFLPEGWLFMILIMLLESFILSKLLCHKKIDKQIYISIFGSNIISGAVGIITTLALNGGWILVVWFPWVSSHEINISEPGNLLIFVLFYLVAFILTLILESFTNWLFLKRKYKTRQILINTLIANIISYLIGTFILYYFPLNDSIKYFIRIKIISSFFTLDFSDTFLAGMCITSCSNIRFKQVLEREKYLFINDDSFRFKSKSHLIRILIISSVI